MMRKYLCEIKHNIKTLWIFLITIFIVIATCQNSYALDISEGITITR